MTPTTEPIEHAREDFDQQPGYDRGTEAVLSLFRITARNSTQRVAIDQHTPNRSTFAEIALVGDQVTDLARALTNRLDTIRGAAATGRAEWHQRPGADNDSSATLILYAIRPGDPVQRVGIIRHVGYRRRYAEMVLTGNQMLDVASRLADRVTLLQPLPGSGGRAA